MKNKVFITWDQVDTFLDKVKNDFIRDKKVSGVYGIPRGGLCLAAMLSYRTGLPLLMAPTKDCIIIDDIADSGRSLLHYTENDTQFNKYYIVTMFYADRSMVKPDYWEFLKKNDWIVFPWEKGEDEC